MLGNPSGLGALSDPMEKNEDFISLGEGLAMRRLLSSLEMIGSMSP